MKEKIFGYLFMSMMLIGTVSADSQWSQVSWYTAETVAHSISYGVYNTSIACSQSALYYVEPSPINGIASHINASTDSTGVYKCQNSTQGAFTIRNDGSVGIKITAGFNSITSGVKNKIGFLNGAYQTTCSGTCAAIGCNLNVTCIELSTSPKLIKYNMAMNSTQAYWLWADFNGVVGTVAPTKGNLTTTAVKAVN